MTNQLQTQTTFYYNGTSSARDTLRNALGDKFFSVRWTKNDGTESYRNCRLISTAADANTRNIDDYLLVWSVSDKEYRLVRFDTISELKARGRQIKFKKL